MKTSDKIKKLCQIMGWSKARLAREFGVSQSYMSFVSNGKGEFSQDLQAKFDVFYEKHINPPLGTQAKEPAPAQAPAPALAQEVATVIPTNPIPLKKIIVLTNKVTSGNLTYSRLARLVAKNKVPKELYFRTGRDTLFYAIGFIAWVKSEQGAAILSEKKRERKSTSTELFTSTDGERMCPRTQKRCISTACELWESMYKGCTEGSSNLHFAGAVEQLALITVNLDKLHGLGARMLLALDKIANKEERPT